MESFISICDEMAKNPAKTWHIDANLHVYVHLDCKSMRRGGGGGDVVFALAFAQSGRVSPFSNNFDDDCRYVQNISRQRF